jgi:rhamnosyltransferase
LKELPAIKKENEFFKKAIGWYKDTYETRSILGVLKTKLESKFKKKNDSASTQNPSAKTASESNSINAIGKSRYPGRLNLRHKSDTSHVSKACIFSSFSFSGEVDEYVFYYLDELKKAGFSTVFVSTSILPKRSVQRLSQYACLIIERDNICPDFGSWKAGLSLLDWDKLDAVILTNDSVFGPLFNLDDIILSMKDGYDVWGMSDNYEGLHFSWNPPSKDHHLQSYFLYFNKKAVTSDTFQTFWDRLDLSASKEEVIERYEIGISRAFKDSGFRLGAYANADVVSKNAPPIHKVMNQLFVSWKPLIKDHKFPFLKRELLIRRDISKTHEVLDLYVNTSGWRKTIEEHSLYPIRLVDDFITTYYRLNKTTNNNLVLRNRKLLFLVDLTEDAGSQEMLLTFLNWLKAKTETEVEFVSCRQSTSELTPWFARFGKITNLYALSEPEKKSLKGRLIDGISLVFSNTIRHVEAQKFLSFLDIPQVIFVHETASLFDRVPSEDDLNWMKNNVSNFITDSDIAAKFVTEHVGIDSAKVKLVDKSADFTAVQAPALLRIINTYHDDKELRLVEDPVLVFMAHIYYDDSWIEIRDKLRNFNNGRNYFLFSISEGCLIGGEIIESIKESFDNAYYLVTPNLGKDIGGKLALIDLYLFLEIRSSYIVMLHDKQSLHSVYGESWKSELFKVFDFNNLPAILDLFRDPAVGVVGTKKWIVNEYDARTGNFANNSQLSKELCKRFHISIENYDFIGGTMFWIRSSVIEKFFRKNDPILIRGELESGNVMDSHGESVTHTWERMFSWIATNDGYRVAGI